MVDKKLIGTTANTTTEIFKLPKGVLIVSSGYHVGVHSIYLTDEQYYGTENKHTS